MTCIAHRIRLSGGGWEPFGGSMIILFLRSIIVKSIPLKKMATCLMLLGLALACNSEFTLSQLDQKPLQESGGLQFEFDTTLFMISSDNYIKLLPKEVENRLKNLKSILTLWPDFSPSSGVTCRERLFADYKFSFVDGYAFRVAEDVDISECVGYSEIVSTKVQAFCDKGFDIDELDAPSRFEDVLQGCNDYGVALYNTSEIRSGGNLSSFHDFFGHKDFNDVFKYVANPMGGGKVEDFRYVSVVSQDKGGNVDFSDLIASSLLVDKDNAIIEGKWSLRINDWQGDVSIENAKAIYRLSNGEKKIEGQL